jgi:hypothetical protein
VADRYWRRLAGQLSPGGIVAFQDLNFIPAEAGFNLRRVLVEAGLPAPRMRLESLVEGGRA